MIETIKLNQLTEPPILYFCLLHLSIFLVGLKDIVEYCIRFCNHIDISEMFYQKSRQLTKYVFSKHLDRVRMTLTVL